MQQSNQNSTPESDRHNAGQPDTNFDGNRLGTGAFGAPGIVAPSQQSYDTGSHSGIDAGQQRGNVTVDQSQKYDDLDTTDKRGGGTDLGARHTVGGFNASGENVDPFRDEVGEGGQNRIGRRENQDGGNNESLAIRQEERERGGTNQGNGWEDNSGGVAGANAPGSFGRHSVNDASRHGAGAAAGLAHHTKDGRSEGGLFDRNDDQRQRERDFAGTHSVTGIDANAGLGYDDTQVTGAHPNRNSARGATDTLGTSSEHVPDADGVRAGSATGRQDGARGNTGDIGNSPDSIPSAFGGGTGMATGLHSGIEHAGSRVPAKEAAVADPGLGPGSDLSGGKAGDHAKVAGAKSADSGSGQVGAGHTPGGQSAGSGTTDIVIGKLEQGAGKLLKNDTMRAKGLEKEAKGEALRDAPHAQELVQEAAMLRERAGQKNSAKDTRDTKNDGDTGKSYDKTSGRV